MTTQTSEQIVNASMFYEQNKPDILLSISVPQNVTVKRNPVDVIFVIDKSGSMGSSATQSRSKMELVRDTLDFALTQFNENDNVGLIVFDSVVTELTNLRKMTTEQKAYTSTQITKITANSSTNLSGGIMSALNMLKSNKTESSPQKSTIIVLTDGQANIGLIDTQSITTAISNENDDVANIYTIGFGCDCNANMLKAIAETTNGTYNFVANGDSIPQAFSAVLGSVFSVVVQSATANMTVVENQFAQVHNVSTTFSDDKKSVDINVGDMYTEQTRDILITLNTDNFEGITTTVTYFNLVTSQTESVICNALTQDDLKVNTHRNRINAVAAMKEATEFACNRNLPKAQEVLTTAIKQIEESQSSEVQLCKDLVSDIKKLLTDFADERRYYSLGSHNTASLTQTYDRQCFTTSALPEISPTVSAFKNNEQTTQYTKFSSNQDKTEKSKTNSSSQPINDVVGSSTTASSTTSLFGKIKQLFSSSKN